MNLKSICGLLAVFAFSQSSYAANFRAPELLDQVVPQGAKFYVTIEGAKQGRFKGESKSERHKDQVEGVRFAYGVKTARDAASGQASGKRMHSPVTITKEWGAASPQIFQAVVTNEVMKSVAIDFVRTNPEGVEYVYQTIRLTNASISEVRQFNDRFTSGAVDLEDVAFTFQRIDIENKDGKTSASDTWASN